MSTELFCDDCNQLHLSNGEWSVIECVCCAWQFCLKHSCQPHGPCSQELVPFPGQRLPATSWHSKAAGLGQTWAWPCVSGGVSEGVLSRSMGLSRSGFIVCCLGPPAARMTTRTPLSLPAKAQAMDSPKLRIQQEKGNHHYWLTKEWARMSDSNAFKLNDSHPTDSCWYRGSLSLSDLCLTVTLVVLFTTLIEFSN